MDTEPRPEGRPTVMTEDVIRKLEEVFLIGGTDKEACLVANISMATLYKYCQDHPEFSERKEALKDTPKYQARRNVANAIQSADTNISTWYLERKAKNEFSQRTEQTGAEGKPLLPEATDVDLDKVAEEVAAKLKVKKLE